jgi:hypothetical protein
MSMNMPMTTTPFARAARALAAALLVGALAPSFATPLMDMRAEDLMFMASDMKKSLNLNPNQTLLWQQVESRSRALLRERTSRRERLQAKTKTTLEGAAVELREIGAALDAEGATTLAEEKQLREWWLTVNDALDEPQRATVARMVAEQMLKVDGGDVHGGKDKPADGGGGQKRGGAGGRRGGGGMGGGGPGG